MSVMLTMNPYIAFSPQGGTCRASEVSSRWAGELGYGGPSGRGFCETQGNFQSIHWRGPETGQVRSSVSVLPANPVAHHEELLVAYRNRAVGQSEQRKQCVSGKEEKGEDRL